MAIADTDVLMDGANGDKIAVQQLVDESQVSALSVSTITVMELIVGYRNKTELTAA